MLNWIKILIFVVIICDTAIAGVAAYNNSKLKKEASRGSSDDSETAQSVPMSTTSTHFDK